MMELALIKTLLNREFYDQHKGIRCPDKIFSKDVRKIKQALAAMEAYDNDFTVSDLQAVFNRINASRPPLHVQRMKICSSVLR